MAQQGFDISKYITAADIVSAVTAGTIAYLTYKTKQDEPKPEQPQQGQPPQGQATPTTGSKATDFYDEVPDVPEMTPQDNSMVNWGRSWYSGRGFNNCSTGNDILFPSKWQVEDFAEQIGCEPGKLQALLDKGAGEKMFAKLMSLGQTGNFSAGNLAAGAGFQATNINNMTFILDGQGHDDAVAAMYKTLLDGGSVDAAARSFLTSLRGFAPTSLFGSAVKGALANLGG